MVDSERYEKHDINFPTTFFGLIFRPVATIDHLYTYPKPLYACILLLFFLATLAFPLLISFQIHGAMIFSPQAILNLFLVIILVFLYFVFVESFFLSLFGLDMTVPWMAQTACFCLSPITVLLWILYYANYQYSGSISLMNLAMGGDVSSADQFINKAPYIINISLLLMASILFQSIRRAGNLFAINALIITAVSMIPLHLAIILAILTSNLISPGSADVFIQMIYSPAALILE